MPRLALLITSLVALTACFRNNSKFCELAQNANRPECADAGSGGPCESNDECMAALPVCDPTENGGTCVLCTATDRELCTGMTPRCDNHACVACVDDGDCGVNGVCLPAGDCADPGRIIHAKATGGSDAATCGALGSECTLSRALLVVTASKDIIKLDDPVVYMSEGGFQIDGDPAVPITIAARGAALQRRSDDAVLTIHDGRDLTLLGGTITEAGGSNGDGILCKSGGKLSVDGTTFTANDASAIEAEQCTLRIRKAIIRNNSARAGQHSPAIQAKAGSLTLWLSTLDSNKGGGVSVTDNGHIAIVGNLFHNNGESGNSPSDVAGLAITTTADPANRLEFNTIVNSQAGSGQSQGVQCNPGDFTARNNIIWDTDGALGLLLTGTCKHAYSDIGQTVLPINEGGNNLNLDPLFETDFRVKAGSPVRMKAAPDADLRGIASVDMAGRARTPPADIGAYQVPTP